jgi:protein phosphatase
MSEGRTSERCSGGGLAATWMSDIGPRGGMNEDACTARPEEGIFIVSDGMGGEHAGELASACVIEWTPRLVTHHLERLQGEEVRDVELALRDAVLELNHRVRQESSQLDGVRRMGATVVLAVVRGPRVHVAHMGDSRAYLLAAGRLQLLTADHSVAAILHRRGALTAEQAARHPMRARLSRYVGMGGNAYADLRTVDFGAGDRLLLCTDGLIETLVDADIAACLNEGDSPEDTCAALVGAARSRDSHDNITVMIVERSSVAAKS